MMRFLNYFLLIFLVVGCVNRMRVTDVSSTGIEIQFNSKTPEELYKKWYLSIEEKDSTGGILTYRPEGYAFPSVRFRPAFQIEKSGKYMSFESGQDDKPVIYEGHWIYDKASKIIEVSFKQVDFGVGLVPITMEEKRPFTAEIIFADKNVIKLKVLKQKPD